MRTVLMFIDGTICDTRRRHHLVGTPDFYRSEEILKDLAVPGSVQCLQELAQRYEIVYIGTRPVITLPYTEEWLEKMGFPKGPVYLADTREERLALARELREKFDFIAGVGDRWDDNELHLEIGCLSIILKEFEGNWDIAHQHIVKHEREESIKENEVALRGKIEGLARVLSPLHANYGDDMWEVWFEAVQKMAETTRDEREKEDREAFARHGLSPEDLRDAAKLDKIALEEDWEQNPAFGLQDIETVEATERRHVSKVTRCVYAELWQEHGRPDIGYQIHCRTDIPFLDQPVWNPKVRLERPKTLMQDDDSCLFIQYLPDDEDHAE